MWPRRVRAVIAIGILVFCGILALRLRNNPTLVTDPPPSGSQPAIFLDPNTADAAALAAIPGMGPARANAIVAYREAFNQDHPGQTAFEQLDDLRQIKGLGDVTLHKIEPYLVFPATQPRP